MSSPRILAIENEFFGFFSSFFAPSLLGLVEGEMRPLGETCSPMGGEKTNWAGAVGPTAGNGADLCMKGGYVSIIVELGVQELFSVQVLGGESALK